MIRHPDTVFVLFCVFLPANMARKRKRDHSRDRQVSSSFVHTPFFFLLLFSACFTHTLLHSFTHTHTKQLGLLSASGFNGEMMSFLGGDYKNAQICLEYQCKEKQLSKGIFISLRNAFTTAHI